MPKREYLCDDCGANFTVSVPKGFDIQFCPSCGSEIVKEDANDYEED
jgi:DNA-directed RNA polymerase subunit RPC12/RpoP